MSSLSSSRNAVDAALGASIINATFVDVQFLLYSRRLRTGNVGGPVAAYGNTAVLRASSSYFETLLGGGFAEGTSSLSQRYALPRTTDSYGYDSDSDIEDDDDSEDKTIEVGLGSGSSADDNELQTQQTVHLSPPLLAALGSSGTSAPLRTIAIHDAAFATWRCLLLYIYTGDVSYARLRSQSPTTNSFDVSGFVKGPKCSPKSMYRLADKLNLDALKQHALKDIRSKINRENIFDELFSTLSSQFPQLLEMEIAYFKQHCLTSSILPALNAKLADIAAGKLPHVETAMAALFAAMMSNIPRAPETTNGETRHTKQIGSASQLLGLKRLLFPQHLLGFLGLLSALPRPLSLHLQADEQDKRIRPHLYLPQ